MSDGFENNFFSCETDLNFWRTLKLNDSNWNRTRRWVTVKLLAGFNTQFQKNKKELNFYLLKELRELGDKAMRYYRDIYILYTDEGSDDVIGGSIETLQHTKKNISRNIKAVLFKLGTRIEYS